MHHQGPSATSDGAAKAGNRCNPNCALTRFAPPILRRAGPGALRGSPRSRWPGRGAVWLPGHFGRRLETATRPRSRNDKLPPARGHSGSADPACIRAQPRDGSHPTSRSFPGPRARRASSAGDSRHHSYSFNPALENAAVGARVRFPPPEARGLAKIDSFVRGRSQDSLSPLQSQTDGLTLPSASPAQCDIRSIRRSPSVDRRRCSRSKVETGREPPDSQTAVESRRPAAFLLTSDFLYRRISPRKVSFVQNHAKRPLF